MCRGKAFMTDVAIKVLKVNNLLGNSGNLKAREEDPDSTERAEAALAKALHMLQREAQVSATLHPHHNLAWDINHVAMSDPVGVEVIN